MDMDGPFDDDTTDEISSFVMHAIDRSADTERSTIDCPPLQKFDLMPSIRAGLASNKCGRPMEGILHVLLRY
jgi:hypothetical protein